MYINSNWNPAIRMNWIVKISKGIHRSHLELPTQNQGWWLWCTQVSLLLGTRASHSECWCKSSYAVYSLASCQCILGDNKRMAQVLRLQEGGLGSWLSPDCCGYLGMSQRMEDSLFSLLFSLSPSHPLPPSLSLSFSLPPPLPFFLCACMCLPFKYMKLNTF